jgi:hypothetical protein
MSIKVITATTLVSATERHQTADAGKYVAAAFHHLLISGNWNMLNIAKYWFKHVPTGKKASDFDKVALSVAMFIVKEGAFSKDKETKAYLVQGQKPSLAYKSIKKLYESVAAAYAEGEVVDITEVWVKFRDELIAQDMMEVEQDSAEPPKSYTDKALAIVPKTQKAMDALSAGDQVLAKSIYQLLTGKVWSAVK